MKQKPLFLVLVILIFTSVLSSAQTRQGSFLVGECSALNLYGIGIHPTDIGYSRTWFISDIEGDDNPDRILSINFIPKVGYFVIDNLALGMDFTVSSHNTRSEDGDQKYSSTVLGLGPFIRYYLPTAKVLPFAEINSSFGTQTNKSYFDGYDESEHKSSIMLFGAGIGLAAPLGETVTFDVLAGYQSYVHKAIEDNEDNGRLIRNSFGLKLGFTILFASKEK